MQTSRSLWRSENGEWRRGASPTHNSFPSSWQAALCILKALLNGSRPTFNTDMCISKDQKYKIKKLKRKEHTSFGHSLIFFRQSGGRIHAGRGYWKKKRASKFAWTVNILIMVLVLVFGFWAPRKKSHLKSIYAGIKIQFSRATLFLLQLCPFPIPFELSIRRILGLGLGLGLRLGLEVYEVEKLVKLILHF